MTWSSPRTWVAGETVTASILNTHLRDNFKALSDAWTTFTPTWTAATTNPTLGSGTLTGRYLSASKMASVSIEITIGSTTTFGTGGYLLAGLPAGVTPRVDRAQFDLTVYDASTTANYKAAAVWDLTNTRFILAALPTTAGNALSSMTGTVPLTLATGDKLVLTTGMFEAA